MTDFGRTIRVRVGPSGGKGRDFRVSMGEDGPRIRFQAKKSSAREPNTLAVQLYNLAPESRAYVEREAISVIVEAGYQDRLATFFVGDVARSWSLRENGTDWITHLEGGDGEKAFRDARFSQAFARGTSSATIFRSVASSMGVPLGYVSPRALAPTKVFARGWSFSGPARDAMDELLNDLGLVWSIQDGELVITGEEEATTEPAVIVRAGNLSAPPAPIVENGEITGLRLPLRLSSLYRPERLLDVKLLDFAGLYRVTKVEIDADSGFEDAFTAMCDTRALAA